MSAKMPKPLKQNSTIGLLCPAGGFDDYKPIRRVVEYLRLKGYKVKLGHSLLKSKNKHFKYLAGPDSRRLADLHEFFKDKSIDAVFSLRGGYGSLRLLSDLNFKLIKENKKILLGFSDITVLLLSIYAKCKLITFHGPLLGINFIKSNLKPVDNQSENILFDLLMKEKYSFKYSYKKNGITLVPGKATGVLVGGNLTDICSMIGSEYLPDFKGTILFLEDVNEEPYKIDRLLTQLLNSNLLSKVSGIIFSSFLDSGFKSSNEVLALLKNRIAKLNIPAIYNFPVGHGSKNFLMPIGMKVRFDADNIALSSL